MNLRIIILITLTLLLGVQLVCAQEQSTDSIAKMYRYMSIVKDGDTIPLIPLRPVHVFAQLKFKSENERQQYSRLIRDVKRTYPYAKLIAASIIETYEYMQTIPDEKDRQKHLEDVQKYMMDTYKPEMKKMTRAQGKILMKLVDRQTGASTYDVVKALLGSFKAGVYNVFAGLFGNSLKVKYDPKGEDAEIEAIVIQIEQGTLDYYYSVNYHGFGK